MVAVGLTFVPITVSESLSDIWPSSVALKVTTYVPSSLGAKLNFVPDPVLYALPFLVTVHAYVKPAAVSVAEGLVALPVNGSEVPSGIVGGSVTIRAVGATATTET